MTIIKIIFTLFLTLIYVVTINDFYGLVFRPLEVYSKKILIISYIVLFALSVCLNMFSSSIIINTTLSYLVFLGVTFNFKSSINNKVMNSVFIFLGLIAFESLMPHIFSAMFHTTVNELLENDIAFLYLFTLARLVPFSIMKLIKYKIGDKTRTSYKSVKLKTAEWIMIVSLPVFSVFIMHILIEISKTLEGTANFGIALITLTLILSNLIFYYLYFNSVKSVELQANQVLLEKQISTYENQYAELQSNLYDIQKFKHDTKHRLLNAISELTKENTELQGNLLKELDDVVDGIYSERYECYTGYAFIDIILNYQKNKADAYGISLDLQISPSIEVKVDGKVLSVILGNALDNAIEACVTYGVTEIQVKMMNINNSLHISVNNDYHGVIELIGGLPKTMKDNPDSHGFGLKTIKKLVEDHQGIMSIQTANQHFLLQINLLNN